MPTKPNEVFSYICHFIFAIIIATSYESARDVFIDPEKPFTLDYIFFMLEKPIIFDFSFFIPYAELLLPYTIIVSGWVGYARSMIKWPHKDTKSGAFRFCLDLVILFCYFGLITLTDAQYDFKENFLVWIVALFALFSVSDMIKIKEYYKVSKLKSKKTALVRSFGKTVFVLNIILLIAYVVYSDAFKIQSQLLNEDIGYLVYLILIMILMVVYRWWKWVMPFPKNRRPVR